MKKILLGLALSALAVSSFQVSAERAFVVKDFECPGFVPNGETENGLPALALLTTYQGTGVGAVEGKIGQYTCHFDHDVPLERATAGRGFICAAEDRNGNLVYTLDSTMIATPGGKAVLACKFHAANG